MLDEESPLSAEIMGTVIPRDFRFPDLKYSGRNNPLVHIERFNDMTGVQGLTPAQRCRVFPLTLEGRAREWCRKWKYRELLADVPSVGRAVPRSGSPKRR